MLKNTILLLLLTGIVQAQNFESLIRDTETGYEGHSDIYFKEKSIILYDYVNRTVHVEIYDLLGVTITYAEGKTILRFTARDYNKARNPCWVVFYLHNEEYCFLQVTYPGEVKTRKHIENIAWK